MRALAPNGNSESVLLLLLFYSTAVSHGKSVYLQSRHPAPLYLAGKLAAYHERGRLTQGGIESHCGASRHEHERMNIWTAPLWLDYGARMS
ncbi:hypothetical protein BC827DRAFT_1189141 [Russula dissimulans]|nr:hypothetical protein BC827DRAFT_1189141 [Russula dissimulans]